MEVFDESVKDPEGPILKIILNFFMPDGNKRSGLKAACLSTYDLLLPPGIKALHILFELSYC